jgi:hypothetical protein
MHMMAWQQLRKSCSTSRGRQIVWRTVMHRVWPHSACTVVCSIAVAVAHVDFLYMSPLHLFWLV